MAINVRVTESGVLGRMPGELAPVLVQPPIKSKTYGAAGLTDALAAGSSVYRLRCLGDPIWFRLNVGTDTQQAGANDTKSEYLATGEVYDFMLPFQADPTNWKIDIRATA